MPEVDWNKFKQRVNADPVLSHRGAGSTFRVLLGWGDDQTLLAVDDGAIVSIQEGPFVMPQCDFALNGSIEAWRRFTASRPHPGDQDIFAFFRSGGITLTGDTRKFYAHLMCLKLLLLHLRSQA